MNRNRQDERQSRQRQDEDRQSHQQR
jgi:hypothetical protein